MTRVAWLVLLAACSKEREAPKPAPITPPPQAAPKQQPPSVDQVMTCFSDPISVAVAESISSITTGDFDGDKRTDVIVTYETLKDSVFAGHVVTYRNAGDGRLQEHASLTAGDMVYAISPGDIDKDGVLDLVVNDPRSTNIRLYAGKGDGSFVEKPPVKNGRKAYSGTLADLDGDGNLDMVVEMFSDVAIYKGDGKFGFKRRMVIDTGQAPDGPVVADFDGDKVLDLGYAANDEDYYFTLKGPAFRQNVKDVACAQPGYTSGGDFDDDGDTDMAWVCNDKIELRLNDGKGNFKLVTYPYGPSADPVIAADLTNDGKTDLLVSHRLGESLHSQLTLLEGAGNGEWREAATARLPIINAVKVADMDGDQKLDIVIATWSGRAATILVLLRQDC